MDRWNNHNTFLEDSGKIRTATSHNKRQYLENYNAYIAPRLHTLEANFQVWANILAAMHLPGTNADISLYLNRNTPNTIPRTESQTREYPSSPPVVYGTISSRSIIPPPKQSCSSEGPQLSQPSTVIERGV